MRLPALSALFLLLILSACHPAADRTELITGHWRFTDVTVDTALIPAAIGSNFHVSELKNAMRGISYEFKADKTFRFAMNAGHASEVQNGRYELTEEGRSLRMTKTQNGKDADSKQMNILLLNKDSLVLEEEGVRLIFLKSAE